MTLFFQRTILISLITGILGIGIFDFTSLESTLGLDTLFKIRGARPSPTEVVIVAMDDVESENALNVNDHYVNWRSFHGKLIQELQRQQVALIVFDLHFIVSAPTTDPALATAIQEAGNVLLGDCVQKLWLGGKDDFDGRKCSDNSEFRKPFAQMLGETGQHVSDQLFAMRIIPPTSMLADSALAHAPYYVDNDAGNPVIRNVWNIYDNLAEAPSLPVLTWLYYLNHNAALSALIPSDKPYATWLSERIRNCGYYLDNVINIATDKNKLESHIDRVLCQHNNMYLDFYGPARTLRMESYLDVYNSNVNNLQGKVVFVGKAKRFAAANNDDLDYFQTPYSDTTNGNMSGVEIMATQFANLYTDRFIRPLPGMWHYVLLVGYGFLLTALFTQLGWFRGVIISLSLIGIYVGVAIWCFSRYGWWLPIIVPFLQLVFISAWDLLAWLPFSTAKKTVRSVCLITDIERYTDIAEQLSTERMHDLRATFFNTLGESVIAHSGKINDITGDAMMAVWFDMPIQKLRLSACLAALEILRAVERFNATSNVCLPVRIGLFEGDIKLGPIYAGGHRFFGAVGNTPNITSRIESVNKVLGTRILATKAIVSNTDTIYYRTVGKFCVVGREQPLDLVEIITMQQEVSDIQSAICQQFSKGLIAFQAGNWQDAVFCFQNLLDKFGEDGPSRFYLKLALSYLKHPPLEWGYVKLDEK
ncbi:adenylate/guanylate cyclase domain-containing protein [Methylomonas sp. AM2-LC]|uniref:CHASE2 domain-containing protein n=1 Tax=Methylomonas sp. AM2-LC TaxID=3153301 RepID=UPI00326454D3